MDYNYEYTILDLGTWSRGKHYALYRDCGFPFVGVTTNIDVSALLDMCRNRKMRFFRVFMHILMSIVNEHENFRLRIADNEVVLFSRVDPSFTVIDHATDLFYIAVAESGSDYAHFDRSVERAERRALENKCLSEKRLDLVYMTCLPWLDYSELVQPIFINASDSIPRLAWGKFKQTEGRVEMPFSVAGHHGFIDGVHIARFVEGVCRGMERFVTAYTSVSS